jgi:uncharacterized NAD(P)/FAD-binding protein YdhS
VAKIIDCTGIIKDPTHTTNRAIRSLLDQGCARVEPLRIGLEITADCAIVDRHGTPSKRLFAVGVVSRIFRTFDQATASVCMKCG